MGKLNVGQWERIRVSIHDLGVLLIVESDWAGLSSSSMPSPIPTFPMTYRRTSLRVMMPSSRPFFPPRLSSSCKRCVRTGRKGQVVAGYLPRPLRLPVCGLFASLSTAREFPTSRSQYKQQHQGNLEIFGGGLRLW